MLIARVSLIGRRVSDRSAPGKSHFDILKGSLAGCRAFPRSSRMAVADRLLATVQPDFSASTWEAFRRFGVDGEPAARVAEQLGMTENTVVPGRSRVLKRFRQEAGDLLG